MDLPSLRRETEGKLRNAGTIVGESTGGAGCGYTNGGIPTTLKNSGAKVKMPDCVRFRADGSDEVNGIIPDSLVPWPREGSDYQRAMKLIPVLDENLTTETRSRGEMR
jgi:hypothetical protein